MSQVLMVAAAGAQGATPRLEALNVALWPDYDEPAVLVMYRARLAADVPLPASVPLRIPASVGEPHAVAWRGEDGSLLVARYQRRVEGDWAVVEVETHGRDLRLEYYAPLERDATESRFGFLWPGGLEIESLSYEVQEPAFSSDLTIAPPPQSSRQLGDGLLYHGALLGSVSADSQVTIGIAYNMTTPALSSDSLRSQNPPAASPAPASSLPSTPTSSSSRPSSDWIFFGVVALLVVVIIVLVARRR